MCCFFKLNYICKFVFCTEKCNVLGREREIERERERERETERERDRDRDREREIESWGSKEGENSKEVD